ncbi:hypothetical protein ZWY2020_053786 [Hordeum vulgare]|nr:hypothetical protein ZWY2020_053786 [Hordeum vulgare]
MAAAAAGVRRRGGRGGGGARDLARSRRCGAGAGIGREVGERGRRWDALGNSLQPGRFRIGPSRAHLAGRRRRQSLPSCCLGHLHLAEVPETPPSATAGSGLPAPVAALVRQQPPTPSPGRLATFPAVPRRPPRRWHAVPPSRSGGSRPIRSCARRRFQWPPRPPCRAPVGRSTTPLAEVGPPRSSRQRLCPSAASRSAQERSWVGLPTSTAWAPSPLLLDPAQEPW